LLVDSVSLYSPCFRSVELLLPLGVGCGLRRGALRLLGGERGIGVAKIFRER
jgi:hypothetical protein